MSSRISKEEFFRLLQTSPKAPHQGNADWDAIYKALKETNVPVDISTIQEHYVKGVVTRQRTKNVLQTWAVQGRCFQVWHEGRYWYFFGDQLPQKKSRKTKTK